MNAFKIAALAATRLTCVAALGMAVAPPHAANAAISVCIDKSSPAQAMDHRVIDAVAQEQHTSATVVPFDGNAGGDDDGFDVKEFKKLASSRCELVLGFPVEASSGETPEGTKATTPYGETGFVLLTPRQHDASTLDKLPAGTTVAVTYLTPPNLYFAKHPNIQADIRPDDEHTLASLFQHKVQAAMIWRASAVSALADKNHARDYCMHALSEPYSRWNVVALYAPQNERAAAAFMKSVADLQNDGKLASLVQPFATAPQKSGIILASADAPAPAAAAPSGGDAALYTSAQADAGKKEYADNCAQCHGDNLEGMAGPALKGKNFASPKANFHVSDIFTIVSQNMPATQPGSLTHDQYVNIMAFLLQQNGMPAGSTALTFDAAKSSKTPLVYKGD
ncbi:cytochrome c class I [Acetobacter nitrogenifigens DSM 23921 = NBRC 105050]|uniref:Cytochrome c domain-containing protein n=1 Tax=Acetobacter nitrogenifigens DSM 23921 = NBRC 105050 TaxID=1120919 RepID=A0A511X9H7_9PROT|nr:cytochrome c [Acetobacter nitrogenifigens]GBQ93541.1 cytochrome c class I [Acetobacter nitrogenifigens DSM 23921 = NBRC 105050]GEN59600.1 hypothetical protein ANI02nite_14840 [Acetobacter nitrogenifigens DSM 23921 = NBRC 105050]